MAVEVTRIGPYELVRRLGRGGMAETYLARRHGPGGFIQEVCVKRVLPEFADETAFRDQFLDEATIHGRLQHGNIVRVADFGEHEGTYFLVMELVDGCDLAQLLEAARTTGEGLPVPLAVTIAADLCQALAYAHTLEDAQGRLELVHRDLTPSNVLLTRAGEVKLSDFGIARAAHRRHRTQTGYTKGKFCYMSPEQIEARDDLDGRSDLFALGCVLYEMLAGARPFDAPSGNDLAVLPRILEGQFDPLADRAPHVPAPLVALVHQLLSRERDERPQDALAVLEALAPLLPPVTVRSQLAARVKAVCAERQSAAPAPAAVPEAPTQAVDLEAETRMAFVGEPTEPLSESPPVAPAAAPERQSSSTGRGPSKKALAALLASLGVFALVVLGVVLRPRDEASGAAGAETAADAAVVDEKGRAEGEVAPDAHAAEVPPAEELDVARDGDAGRTAQESNHAPVDPASEATPPAAEPESRERATTDLRVVVVPYGTIWIDGKRRGETRVQATLPAGRHRIGIGRGDVAARTEEVVLEPGRRTLEYALDGAFE